MKNDLTQIVALRMNQSAADRKNVSRSAFMVGFGSLFSLIAGFGSAHWIKGRAALAEKYPLADAELDILDHMNNDHRDNLVDYCRHVHGVETATAEMVGIDCDGFDVRANNQLYRFDFESETATAGAARAALVALTKAARG